MAANLINLVQNDFSDDVIARLAARLNVTPAKTQAALGYAIPAVVGGMYQKVQTAQGRSDLFGVLHRGGFDGKAFNEISILVKLASGPPDLMKAGGLILSSLFGARQGDLVDWLAAASGLGRQTASSLFAMVAAYIASLIGKAAMASGGFNTTSLADLLMAEGPYVAAAAPRGLTQLLSMTALAPVEPPARERKRGAMGWLMWAVPVVLLGLVFWGWGAPRPEPVRGGVAGVTAIPRSATTPFTPRSAPVVLVKRTLSCGQELEVAQDGIESRLIGFIDDRARPASEAPWVSFDRLEFESGSATVAQSSLPQLRNMAAILNCYPNVTIKVRGYTDSVGDAASNLRLSQARADNTVAAIVSQGIPASRLLGEGYGEDNPLASNETPEGRQRNRRIEVRVTKK